jgi:hypothetical protein
MRKRYFYALAVLTSTVLLIAGLVHWCGQASDGVNRSHATWVWDLNALLDGSGGSPDDVVAFLREREVKYVYLHTDDNMTRGETNDRFRSFIRKAGQAGIEVHALGGERDWVLPDKRSRLHDFLARVAEYNDSAQPEERFTGIHLDVEPYLLKQWKTDPESVVRHWIGMMDEFTSFARMRGLETGVDLPFWLDRVPASAEDGEAVTLDRWMMSAVDSVALMSYRDQAGGNNGVLALVQDEMDHARAAGRTVWVGLNVAPDSDNILTFREEGNGSFRRVADRIRRKYGDSPAFGGIAVHDLANWMRMDPPLE